MITEERHEHRIPGAYEVLDVVLTHEPVDGAAVYHVRQGDADVVLAHEQVLPLARELQRAFVEEENRP